MQLYKTIEDIETYRHRWASSTTNTKRNDIESNPSKGVGSLVNIVMHNSSTYECIFTKL